MGRLATFPQVNAFYGHDVVMPALGWRLSWHLRSLAGRDGAMLIVGAFLAIVFGYALITQGRQVRVFLVGGPADRLPGDRGGRDPVLVGADHCGHVQRENPVPVTLTFPLC